MYGHINDENKKDRTKMKKRLQIFLCLILAVAGMQVPTKKVVAATEQLSLSYSTFHVKTGQIQFTVPNASLAALSDPSAWPSANTQLLLNQKKEKVTVVLSPYDSRSDVRYVYLQGDAVNRAVESKKIQLEGNFVCNFGTGNLTFTFPKVTKIEKLGETWGYYDTLHAYPDGNVFAYNVDGKRTYLLTSQSGAVEVTKDGKVYDLKVGEEIATPGIYEITRIEKQEKYVQQVVLYQKGDANGSGKVDLKDLLHLKKCTATSYQDSVTTYASDFDYNGSLDDADERIFRFLLLKEHDFAASKADTLLNGTMPITGFNGPSYYQGGEPDKFVNADIYKKIQELGINTIVFDSNDFSNSTYGDIPMKNLQLAEQYGIGVHVLDHHIDHGGVNSGYLTKDAMAKRVGMYSQYQSFLGIHVVDEPYTDSYMSESGGRYLKDFAPGIALVQKYANLSGYVNLYPYDLKVNEENDQIYTGYLQEILQAGAEMISYDKYPVTLSRLGKRTTDYQRFYKNLELARNESIATGKPFWAYAQAGTIFSGTNYMDTAEKNLLTKAEMQWIINASLSFGARGIQYYQLIQADEAAKNEGNEKDPYDYNRSGLISANGEKNTRYFDAATEMNQYIASIDHILMAAEHQGVIARDEKILDSLENSTVLRDSYKELQSVEGANALVGCFDYYGKTALLVTNCHLTENQSIRLNFTKDCKAIRMNQDTTSESIEGKEISMELGAGQSALLLLENENLW